VVVLLLEGVEGVVAPVMDDHGLEGLVLELLDSDAGLQVEQVALRLVAE